MIILVEDNLSHVIAIEYLFMQRDIPVVHARSSLEGYRVALKYCKETPLRVRAILLDINLPLDHLVAGPDGIDIATLLLDDREAGTIPYVPIAIISANMTPQTEDHAKALGIDAVATKPLSAAFIDHVLTLSIKARSRPNERVAAAARKTFLLAQHLDSLTGPDGSFVGVEVTAEELWCVFATVFNSFRFHKDTEQKRQIGRVTLETLGGQSGFNTRYSAFIAYLKGKGLPYRTNQAQILTYIREGFEKKFIEERLGVGRRKLESDITKIIEEFAVFLSRS